MKYTGTILIPKIQTNIDKIQEDLRKLMIGYDPQESNILSVTILWNEIKDYDEKEAIDLIEMSQKECFDVLQEIQRICINELMLFEEQAQQLSRRLDLEHNFTANHLLGFYRGTFGRQPELVTIYNLKKLEEYLADQSHDYKGIDSVPFVVDI